MEGKYVAYVGTYTHENSVESIFMMWTSFGEL